jgi:hypothetical protein
MEVDTLSAAEFERLGLNDYVGVFGERISDRHFRTLFKRTLIRDGGREDWHRLEIFMPENTRRAPSALHAERASVVIDFPLISAVPVCDVANPTWRELDLLWLAALESFSAGCEEGLNAAKLKRQILEAVMQRVPRIALTFNSARTNFDLKFKAWNAGGRTLATITNKKYRDGQPAEKPDAELAERAERLGYLAGRKYGGHRAPAFRDLVQQGLEQPTSSGNLAYVPRALLRAAKQDALITAASVKNKRALRSMVPTLSSDPAKYRTHDIFTADDFTFPVIWYVPDGKGWFNLVQGQCLIVADWRSWRILQFSLQPDPQYNSKVIRTLFAKLSQRITCPRNCGSKAACGEPPASFMATTRNARPWKKWDSITPMATWCMDCRRSSASRSPTHSHPRANHKSKASDDWCKTSCGWIVATAAANKRTTCRMP